MKRIIEFIRRFFFFIPRVPNTVQISITNQCNFNCQMCQRNDLGVKFDKMPFETFEKVINKLPSKVNDLILTGWGEPLTHNRLADMLLLCRKRGTKTRLTSNGALLSDDVINLLIDSELAAITFSMETIKPKVDSSGHEIKGQLEKISKLAEIVRKRGSVLKIYTQSVMQKDNHDDIMDIVDFAIENKLDRVRLTRLDIRFKEFDRPSFQDELELVKKIDKKLRGTGIGVDFLPHTAFDGFVKHFYRAIYRFLHRGGKYCLRTYGDVYVNIDGEVTPCCSLPTMGLASLLEEDLEKIWKNEHFKKFRTHQKYICGKCDILTVKRFQEKGDSFDEDLIPKTESV